MRASAFSPAMLWYLDGRVNQRKSANDKPNENYARELIEEKALGVHGGYTQGDVMEVARCLTGWTVRDRRHFQKGKVEFNCKAHDDGPRLRSSAHRFCRPQHADFDRVLEIVVRHPATAGTKSPPSFVVTFSRTIRHPRQSRPSPILSLAPMAMCAPCCGGLRDT